MSIFVTEVEDADYEYAHCADEDDQGNESGCGMEYEFYPADDTLHHWHDAVGLVTRKRMTRDEWEALIAWHNEHCHTAKKEN